MKRHDIEIRGRHFVVAEDGSGPPLVYMHGFADVHGVADAFTEFHLSLAQTFRVVAPAHPGCNGSGDISDGNKVEDYLFHYNELFDALGLDRFVLAGHCVGGWLAAEYAVRHPEKVDRLVLMGATGLFVPGEPIADIFINANPDRGTDLSNFRRILFASADAPQAIRYYPDGRGDLDEETRRYAMLRFASAIGFRPPYLYNRPLIDRLYRARMPALVIWGAQDGLTPLAHGHAYAEGLRDARLKIVQDAGHAVHFEKPDDVLAHVGAFLNS